MEKKENLLLRIAISHTFKSSLMNNLFSFTIALIFSIAATLFAIAPGIYSLLSKGKVASYSPEISVLTATLIAIIWYTAFTYDNLKYQNFKNTKEVRSLSTALLSELRWLYDILYEFARMGNFSDANTPTPIPTPILNSVIKDLSMFEDDTVYRITYIFRGLNHFEHKRELHSRRIGGETDSIRTIAAFICKGISELVPELINEGGKLPKLFSERVYGAREIQRFLPDDPFVDIRSSDS